MFRITHLVTNVRTILYRRPPIEAQFTCISSSRPLLQHMKNPHEREPCPVPPPPPPPPPKDDRLFWGAMALLVMAGGFAVYAKQTPEVRDWISINASWFDDVIAVMYQENYTFKEMALHSIEAMKQYVKRYGIDDRPEDCKLEGEKIVAVSEGPENIVIEGDDEEEEEKDPCDPPPSPAATKDICAIESCLKDLGSIIINNYICARDACAFYNKLVEETMVDFTLQGMRDLHGAKAEKEELVKMSLENIQNASAKLEGLIHYFECGVTAPKDAKDKTRIVINDNYDKIKIQDKEYQWENDKSLALDEQWSKVEETILKFVEDTTTMIPGLQYEKRNPYFPGDPDLYLYHTYRYVRMLQEQLPDPVAGMTDRVDRAVAILPQTQKELYARNAALQYTYKQKKAEMDREFRKRYDDQRANNDKILKDALKKQNERHEENLKVKVAQKEKETIVKLNKMVAEKVAAEKKLFAKALYEMRMMLQQVEDKLNERLKVERETRRSQVLWAAGAALLAATKKGDPVVRVDRELNAIECTGEGDKLVMTVLKAIPDSVRENGIVPESVLRERYHKMEAVALRVALVEAEGAPLGIFFMSFVQSIFLFMKLSGIPQAEIDKPPQAPISHLDTFDLLQRARFWIERGNLALALRYVSSLQGASAAAASRWYEAARSHLETRQAAEAVLAHAAALGLQYI